MRDDQDAKGGRGLRVCAYYRMSDDEQRLSIEQQQNAVREFCEARGWVIVKEYEDKGKSGSKDIAKRTHFHRLIADAAKGQWAAIVCYNTSRFGRLDSIAAAAHKDALRKHGVYLETVTEGRIDWRTSMGRIQDAIFSEQNNKYSLDLADSAVRGRHDILERGYWPIGEVPLGYDRQYVEGDVEQMVVPRDKPFSKPRNWHLKLIVNEADAAIVRYIFDRFANADVSARGLVKELNEQGRKAPGSGAWTAQMLLKTLRDQAYIGNAAVGYVRKSNKEAHRRMEQTIKEGVCPAIIDAGTFKIVQGKLATRGRANTSQARAGALSGILICGHCGYRMDKRDVRGVLRYVCSSGSRRQHLGCKQWTVREADLLPLIAQELLAAVDADLLDKLAAKPQETANQLAAQQATVDKLGKQYERARLNLRQADPELFKDMQADVLALKADLDKATNTLTMLKNNGAADAAARAAKWWEDNRDKIVQLSMTRHDYRPATGGLYGGAAIKLRPLEIKADREAVRDLLKALGATLTLHWTPKGDRYHQLTYGELAASISGATLGREYNLDEDSSRRSRARTRDKD